MAMKLELLKVFICFMVFIFSTKSKAASVGITWWCNQTPHPEQCKHHMSHSSRFFLPLSSSSSVPRTLFRNMAVQVAMDHTLEALNHTKQLGLRAQSGREESVWATCVKLYENTLFQLNKTLAFAVEPTPLDIQTWLSAALSNLRTEVTGDGFMAQGITFQNTVGPQNGQAVALVSSSDHSVFYRCSFEAYQDTLFVNSQRQLYEQCRIMGTVDFIFGNAAVVFQSCYIYHGNRFPEED